MQAVFAAKNKLDIDQVRGALCYGALTVGLVANGVWLSWLVRKAGAVVWFVAELLR